MVDESISFARLDVILSGSSRPEVSEFSESRLVVSSAELHDPSIES